jgi:hypothetical protein
VTPVQIPTLERSDMEKGLVDLPDMDYSLVPFFEHGVNGFDVSTKTISQQGNIQRENVLGNCQPAKLMIRIVKSA